MTRKTLDNANTTDLKANVSDVKLQGDPDAWQLVSKASSVEQGWMKSTKRMVVEGGHLYQVTSEYLDDYGDVVACAEALAFVPTKVQISINQAASLSGGE